VKRVQDFFCNCHEMLLRGKLLRFNDIHAKQASQIRKFRSGRMLH
jgi:hypothetical protein